VFFRQQIQMRLDFVGQSVIALPMPKSAKYPQEECSQG
jgi:hypothetical protein